MEVGARGRRFQLSSVSQPAISGYGVSLTGNLGYGLLRPGGGFARLETVLKDNIDKYRHYRRFDIVVVSWVWIRLQGVTVAEFVKRPSNPSWTSTSSTI